MKREIITIDEKRCTGCGECIPGCPEGALQIIDGKARLISDLFCDGLGACLGHCPTGAMKIENREAVSYDEKRVMQESIVPGGTNVIAAHLRHLADHGQSVLLQQAYEYLQEKGIADPLKNEAGEKSFAQHAHTLNHHHEGGCPGSRIMDFSDKGISSAFPAVGLESALRQWPDSHDN